MAKEISIDAEKGPSEKVYGLYTLNITGMSKSKRSLINNPHSFGIKKISREIGGGMAKLTARRCWWGFSGNRNLLREENE